MGRLVRTPDATPQASRAGPGRVTTTRARDAASAPELELLTGKLHTIYTRLHGGVIALTEASWKKVPHSGVARWSRRTRRPSWQTRCQAVSLISVRFCSARTAHRWCQAGPGVVRARATCCHCQTTVCVDAYQNNRMRLSGISAVGDTDPRNRPCLPVSGHAQ